MKKITRIQAQKKRKDRYNIFLSDGDEEAYAFSVDEAILIEFHLRKGLELEEALIEELIEKDNVQKSYGLAINFLSYRMRTVKEMKDYLLKKEINQEHIPIVIDRLRKEKLLDDNLFAEMFVATRINTSSKGPLLIKKELIEKGVVVAIAEEATREYPYEMQYEKILQWAEKKVKPTKKESFKNQIQKLQITLLQKGFAQAVISDALSEIHEEKDNDAEWDALVYQGDKLLRKHSSRHEGHMLKNKVKEGLYRKGFSIEVINQYIDEHMES